MNTSFAGADWIGSSVVGGPRSMAPSPYFRKSIVLTKPVKLARLCITALGCYEAEINGVRVGDHVLAPGWTDYKKRVQWQSYDVTNLLSEGANALGAILGDAWYCGFIAEKPRQTYGDRPRLLASLEITHPDDTVTRINTDTTWKTEAGPILGSDILQGEAYDARLEFDGWSSPGFDDSTWKQVLRMPNPGIDIVRSEAPPVRRIEVIAPISMHRTARAGRVFDFGQNFSGRVRLKVKGARGTTLTIRHAETLNPDGTLFTANLRKARAEDFYTCRGDEMETWEPRFTFHGFRYVEILGGTPEHQIAVKGIVLHSDTKPTGSFVCSHPLLNQLQHNIVWGQKSNFLEVPTDCPQRDERLGWTGDAQVFVRTACFNMDVRGFFHKWMQDMRDAQPASGLVTMVVPDVMDEPQDGGPAWADAAIICPWTIYLCYGDLRILEEQYESMQRYMNFVGTKCCKDFIRSHPDLGGSGGFGDWLAIDGSGANVGNTPRDLIGTAFYAYDAELMAKIATVLNREKDAAEYRALHTDVSAAFRRRFLTDDGLITGGTQTSYVLALHFGLVPEGLRSATARHLVRDIENRDFHLSTGFVGTPYLLAALEDNGYRDIAYRLLEQETFPSWLFPVKNGATTIWERWDGWTPEKGFQYEGMNSFNHYAYGAVGAWMYRTVAGLELDENEPGYKHIIFRPRPGGSITWAKAKLETPFGVAGICWELEDGVLGVDVTVPPGTRATFSAPEGFSCDASSLEAGSHRVVAKKIIKEGKEMVHTKDAKGEKAKDVFCVQ